MEIVTTYKEEMYFEAQAGEHVVGMDASPQFGGKDKGLLPKKLLLASLAGCTGMDVVPILKKMKQSFKELKIKVKAEVSKGEPTVFTKIHLQYIFKGENIDQQKVEKAVSLSQNKYCSISAMLKKAAEISWEIVYQ